MGVGEGRRGEGRREEEDGVSSLLEATAAGDRYTEFLITEEKKFVRRRTELDMSVLFLLDLKSVESNVKCRRVYVKE